MDEEKRQLELRIYARRATWMIVFLGGLIFVGGLRLSGLDLNQLESKDRSFIPGKHVCLRSEWLETREETPVEIEICVEWIDLADQSGNTHELVREDLEIIKGPDGRIHTKLKKRINFPLLGMILFMGLLVYGGKRAQRHLIWKKRLRLGIEERHPGE